MISIAELYENYIRREGPVRATPRKLIGKT